MLEKGTNWLLLFGEYIALFSAAVSVWFSDPNFTTTGLLVLAVYARVARLT